MSPRPGLDVLRYLNSPICLSFFFLNNFRFSFQIPLLLSTNSKGPSYVEGMFVLLLINLCHFTKLCRQDVRYAELAQDYIQKRTSIFSVLNFLIIPLGNWFT